MLRLNLLAWKSAVVVWVPPDTFSLLERGTAETWAPKLCGTPAADLARLEPLFEEGVLRRDWPGLDPVLSLRPPVGLGGWEPCWLPPLLLLPPCPCGPGSGSLPQYSRPFGPTVLPLLCLALLPLTCPECSIAARKQTHFSYSRLHGRSATDNRLAEGCRFRSLALPNSPLAGPTD
uniref:Uncharacterized protein n=1 Tax=Anopheles coluzzii TaxID=1518534 RepID=A0A8W7PCI0_ANOCL